MGKGPVARVRQPHKWNWRFIPAVVLLPLLLSLIYFQRASGAGTVPLSDAAPFVAGTYPQHNAVDLPPTLDVELTFSEPVRLEPNAISLACSLSSIVSLAVSGGPTEYLADPVDPLAPGDDCLVTVWGNRVADLDANDPPDRMLSDASLHFAIGAPVATDVIINEVDAVVGSNGHEFIELYDGGFGGTALDGLQLALYNGQTDTIYTNALLNGYLTDAEGYFLISSDPATADLLLARDALLDGPAAVALYVAPGGALPIGSPVIQTGLIDAIVYDSGQPDDSELLPLLEPGQPQVHEASRGQAATDSNQRCPNAAGGQRKTSDYTQETPSPGRTNVCLQDDAPTLNSFMPADGSVVPAADVELIVTFSEPVGLAQGAITLICGPNTLIPLAISGGPTTFTAQPQAEIGYDQPCVATVNGQFIHDLDTNDPPDLVATDVVWRFATAKPVATHMLINEVDSDTPGQDTAEFIELYDGGGGATDLSGLIVVLFNGSTDKSYRVIDLNGGQTDADGTFVIGNPALAARDLTLPNASLQNGPDAVALYARKATDFPTGTTVTTVGLVDAYVYGNASTPDTGLLALLEPGQQQIDENGRSAAEQHAGQRCPHGSGGQRRTATFRPSEPTAGAPNVCASDAAPEVRTTIPADGAVEVPSGTSLSITFSESVAIVGNGISLNCTDSGTHTLQLSGGPQTFTLLPTPVLSPSETCTATVKANFVTDVDTDDPPDQMIEDYGWSFATANAADRQVLINEIDADTPGVDQAEFIELYDGGRGRTSLRWADFGSVQRQR